MEMQPQTWLFSYVQARHAQPYRPLLVGVFDSRSVCTPVSTSCTRRTGSSQQSPCVKSPRAFCSTLHLQSCCSHDRAEGRRWEILALSQGINYFVHPKKKQTGLPGEAALGTKTSATVALCVAGTVCRRWRLATPRCSNCAGGQLERRHAWEPRTGGSRIHTGGGSVLHAWLNAVCQAATLKHDDPFQVLRAQVRSLLDQPLFSRRSLRA